MSDAPTDSQAGIVSSHGGTVPHACRPSLQHDLDHRMRSQRRYSASSCSRLVAVTVSVMPR